MKRNIWRVISFVIMFVVFMTPFLITCVQCNETAFVFRDEVFFVAVNNSTRTGTYIIGGTLILPEHETATLFFTYTNEVNNTIAECVLLEVTIKIGSEEEISRKYFQTPVQSVTIERDIAVTPGNHDVDVSLFGLSECDSLVH